MKHPRFHQQLADKRLERLPRFLVIFAVVGGLFWFYYWWFTTDRFTELICGAGTVLSLIFYLVSSRPKFKERRRIYRLIIANLSLACAAGLVFAESLYSGLGDSTSPIFFGCLVLTAAHLMGTRWSLLWTVLSLAAIAALHFGFRDVEFAVLRNHGPFDYFLAQVGLTIAIFCMSLQSEWSFDRYAYHFISTSEELKERERSLSLAEEVARVGHWRWDGTSPIVMLSNEAATICDLAQVSSDKHTLDDFIAQFTEIGGAKLRKALESAATQKSHFEFDLSLDHEGEAQFVKCIGFSESATKRNTFAVFGVLKDETETQQAKAELNELAEFDQLSGLANRHNFHNQLARSVQHCKTSGSQLTLLLIDLNGFKEINDTMGHASGDAILRDVGKRLDAITRNTDTVARLGGDEFTLILNSMGKIDDIKKATSGIIKAIGEPYLIRGKPVRVGASIGAAIYPDDSKDIEELVAFADTAMYEAKTKRTGVEIYQSWMTEKILQRREIESMLREGLDNNDFFLEYQAQVTCQDQQLHGAEALLRWRHNGKVVSPIDFIPALETSGAIVEVGSWILCEACRQAKEWYDKGYRIRVSVNLSPIQFRDSSLVDHVIDALETSQLRAELLDLEITESVLIDGLSETIAKIQLLKDIGVFISIDDFGTGYSSLSYLKHLPLDRLKIDRAFIQDIPDAEDGTFASTIVVLGHSLGMTVLAEGVETQAQLDFLREHDCDEFQGYLFSRPVKADECEKLMTVAPKPQAPTIPSPDFVAPPSERVR